MIDNIQIFDLKGNLLLENDWVIVDEITDSTMEFYKQALQIKYKKGNVHAVFLTDGNKELEWNIEKISKHFIKYNVDIKELIKRSINLLNKLKYG